MNLNKKKSTYSPKKSQKLCKINKINFIYNKIVTCYNRRRNLIILKNTLNFQQTGFGGNGFPPADKR